MEASTASYMDTSRLERGEFVGMGSALVLFASTFLPWFETKPGNGRINDAAGAFNAWETFATLDVLLAMACSAPFILAWIVARGHALTWRRGEITMIVGMTAFVLILLNGVVLGRPGEPDSEIEFRIGYLVAILASLGICASGLVRQTEGGKLRKPPGTL